jgi:hypothetical protein
VTATQARVALKAAAPLLLGAVLSALVCYPFAGGRLLLLDFVSARTSRSCQRKPSASTGR